MVVGLLHPFDRLTTDVLVAGVSQGIVVIGWVALWAPAERFVLDRFPHRSARKRYAEFAEIELRFAWEPSRASDELPG